MQIDADILKEIRQKGKALQTPLSIPGDGEHGHSCALEGLSSEAGHYEGNKP